MTTAATLGTRTSTIATTVADSGAPRVEVPDTTDSRTHGATSGLVRDAATRSRALVGSCTTDGERLVNALG